MDKSFLIFLAIPVFFLMIGIELLYGYLKNKNNYRLNDTITSINIGLLSRFPTILNLGLQGAAFAYAASYLNMKLLQLILYLRGYLHSFCMTFFIIGCIGFITNINFYGQHMLCIITVRTLI